MIALATFFALLSIAAGTVVVITTCVTTISNSGAMFSMNGVSCPGTVVTVQQAAGLWVTNSRIGAIEMRNDMANFELTISGSNFDGNGGQATLSFKSFSGTNRIRVTGSSSITSAGGRRIMSFQDVVGLSLTIDDGASFVVLSDSTSQLNDHTITFQSLMSSTLWIASAGACKVESSGNSLVRISQGFSYSRIAIVSPSNCSGLSMIPVFIGGTSLSSTILLSNVGLTTNNLVASGSSATSLGVTVISSRLVVSGTRLLSISHSLQQFGIVMIGCTVTATSSSALLVTISGTIANSVFLFRNCLLPFAKILVLSSTMNSSTIRIQGITFSATSPAGGLLNLGQQPITSSHIIVSGVTIPSTATVFAATDIDIKDSTLFFECVQVSTNGGALLSVQTMTRCNLTMREVLWTGQQYLVTMQSNSIGNRLTIMNSFLTVSHLVSSSVHFDTAVVGCSVWNGTVIAGGISIGGAIVSVAHNCVPGTSVRCGASETATESPTPPSRTRVVTITKTVSDSPTVMPSSSRTLSISWLQSSTIAASQSTTIGVTCTCPSRTNSSTNSHHRSISRTTSRASKSYSISVTPTATMSPVTLSHDFTLTWSATVSSSQSTSLSLSCNESSVTASVFVTHSHSVSESQLITWTMAGSRSMSTSFPHSGTTSTTISQTNSVSTTVTLTSSCSLSLSTSAAPATSSTTMSSSPSLSVSFSRSPSPTAMTESRMQTLSTLLSVSLSTQRSTSTSAALSVTLSQSITFTTTDAATNSLSRTLSLSTSRETSSSATLRITATNHYSHTNSSTKSRSDSLTPSYTDTASNSSSPSDSTSRSVTLSRTETPSGTATHVSSLSPSLEPTNSFHRTRSNTSTGTATIMPPPEPEVFTTIAKIAQAVSTTAAVGSAVSGGDVSNANILMLLSTIDCSGGGAMLSVAAKAVSVFGEYGFVAMGLINLGLLLGISVLHFCVVVCAAWWRYGGESWLAVSGERGYRFPFLTLLLVDLLVPQALFGAAAALTRVPELSAAFVVLNVVSLVVIAAIVCGREALLHVFVMPQITIHAYGRNLNLDAAEAEAPMNADGDAAAAEDSDFDDLWLGGDVVAKPPAIAAAAFGDVGDGEAPSCRSRARLLLRSVLAALSPTHYWEPAPLRISMGLLFTRQRSRGFVCVSGLELWMALMTSVFVVVASAFDDVVCTAVTGVLGVLYVAGGVFLVATRLYRLPLDNIVVPVNYFSFAAVCLLKAVSQAVVDPQSLDNSKQEALKKAAEVLQMIQSVTLVLKVVGGMYMMWRERRLYQEELDTRETQLNDMLGDVEIDDTPSMDALQQEFADALELGGPSTVEPRSSIFAVNVADLASALRDFLTTSHDLPPKSRPVEDAPLKLDLNSGDYFLSSAAFPTDEERAAMDASCALDNAFRAMDRRALASTKDTVTTALPTAGRARRKSLKRSSKPNLRPFDWGDLF